MPAFIQILPCASFVRTTTERKECRHVSRSFKKQDRNRHRRKPRAGRSTVLSLAKRGVGSIFTYNSNLAEAEKVSELAAQSEVKAVAVQLNTGLISAFDGFVKRAREILRDFGAERFDYLVNNAGISNHTSIDKMTKAELDDLYNVHFKGVFFSDAKAAAAHQ